MTRMRMSHNYHEVKAFNPETFCTKCGACYACHKGAPAENHY